MISFGNMKGCEWLLLLGILALFMQEVNGKLFCFRRVKKQGRCGGHLKVSYDSPEECCAGKGAGFFSKKQKVGRNRFVCTPCTDLQTPSDRQGDVSPKAKQLNRKPGQKQPVPETTTESKTTTQQTTTTTTVQDWLRPENDHPASHYVSFRRPDDDVDRVEWSQWSPCSASCGAGWRSRYKICDNCDKNDPENVMSQPCMVNFYCNVDGNWGPWFPWQPCSQSCGGGTRLRQRKCNYPPPAYGGSPCSGPAKNSQDCNEQPCPVDGNWGEWSEFTLCSATCGLGTKKRMRECDNPAPASGGRMCAGLPVFAKKCEIAKCPQDGEWSLWTEWSACATTCGEGLRSRTRTCDSPRPLHGGKECEGELRRHPPVSAADHVLSTEGGANGASSVFAGLLAAILVSAYAHACATTLDPSMAAPIAKATNTSVKSASTNKNALVTDRGVSGANGRRVRRPVQSRHHCKLGNARARVLNLGMEESHAKVTASQSGSAKTCLAAARPRWTRQLVNVKERKWRARDRTPSVMRRKNKTAKTVADGGY
ncbi:uncharacterized protein LOC112571665 isoform X2 [Pomacea canaliculata]|uniref:uncharacterized protein LOC112571665 isoform X2 n=1 Tax=Pomacea canaliculata TaxID=400727 RepID=UPI000D7372BB|nr:uncharacterized protein LOC112571665 isoform X2 [Pomacea canaliculata]